MIRKRINQLREIMKAYEIQAYIIPGTDAHGNEFVPDFWQRRAWISGFTGSYGDVIITMDKAGLWTDSRYYLQAEYELKDSNISLFKIGLEDVPDKLSWLIDNLKAYETAGMDPELLSCQDAMRWMEKLKEEAIQIKFIEENLIDRLWTDKPGLPEHSLFILADKYAGESATSKLSRLRMTLKENNTDCFIFSKLDSIAWLFNIRGSDIAYNPLVLAYAVITQDRAFLFIRNKIVPPNEKMILDGYVQIHDYNYFKGELNKITQNCTTLLIDPRNINYWIYKQIQSKKVLFSPCPVERLKSIKNEIEIEGFKRAHVYDGIAMVKLLYWIKTNFALKKITEIDTASRLEEFREKQAVYKGPSFKSITAYGAHSAVVHYSPTLDTNIQLKEGGLFLIDAGAHYLDGTTDITRTIALGVPSKEQKYFFTCVLKANIALTSTQFPTNTKGIQLDAIARKVLWDVGADYGHGSGHGVGSYLCVHEGPQRLSYIPPGSDYPLQQGMFVSIEPGFYKEGEYGIRIENLAVIIKNPATNFLCFDIVTLCPIDLSLVELHLLNKSEINFINQYHEKVYLILKDYLDNKEKRWLRDSTLPIL